MTSRIGRLAVLGTSLPRQCGIATFTTDLTRALAAAPGAPDLLVLAMTDAGRRHAYPDQVRFEIPEDDLEAYLRAADFLNVTGVDLLSVQHEFGIFGGVAGAHLLALLRAVHMPVVTTLHTVLATPNAAQARVMNELVMRSARLVVMSTHGAALLRTVYEVPASRIDVIPHGAPSVPPQADAKRQLGLSDRSLLLTFGLLSPDKGIEYLLDALPAIAAAVPDVTYIVLGATHPHVRASAGESYREMLEARAQALGIAERVIFDNRFVNDSELACYLAAADVCVTPYLQPEQITSGALAYAVGAGKAIVSTGFRYALELLQDGRGRVVPFRDGPALAVAVTAALREGAAPPPDAALREQMRWPAVARAYLESFSRVSAVRRIPSASGSTLLREPAGLPALTLSHVQRLTDDTGILQHARYATPRYADGYCVDDNARALLLMMTIGSAMPGQQHVIDALSDRYLAFVNHAFNPERGRFWNFMSYNRGWTEVAGSDDSHGRSLWALGRVVGTAAAPGIRSLAGDLFQGGLPASETLTSPRAWAYTLLGIDHYLGAFEGDRAVAAVRDRLAQRLLVRLRETRSPSWYWFEDRITYCNARLPEALLVSGHRMQSPELLEAGMRALLWLVAQQRGPDGCFAPVGSDGFRHRGVPGAAFDQQPVEACAFVSACLTAARVTGDDIWQAHAHWAFDWYLGRNMLRLPLVDHQTGGCCDALHHDRVNLNQGAEATLSYLQSLAELRAAHATSAMLSSVAVLR